MKGQGVADLIQAQVRAQRATLLLSSLTAAAVSMAAAALLGVSGWFLTGAALAGLAGPAAAQAFNYLVPSAVIRLLAILRTGLRYVERVSGHQAALDALAELRPELFRRTAAKAPEQLLAAASGEVSSRLVQDVDTVQSAFVRRSAPWAAVGGMAAGVALASVAGWPSALITLSAVLASLLLARFLGRRLADAAGRESQEALGRLKSQVSALEQAAPELRAYGAAGWAQGRVASRAAELDAARLRLARAAGWIAFAQLGVAGIAVAVILSVSPGSDPAATTLAVLAAIAAVEGAGAYAEAARQAGTVTAAVERLDSLGGAPDEIGRNLPSGHGLELNGRAVLASGHRLAIVGPSGCGKTSLIERLMALRAARAGEWRAGGSDIVDLSPQSLRPFFAYAAQEPRFIGGTVRENLCLAAPPAADSDLWRALQDAGLAERFRAAQGLETRLADNARELSGGERRRLALARAYLKPAPWLVLDEPTEGLDEVIANKVIDNLERRLAATGQGLILITHRKDALRLVADVVRMGPAVVEPAEQVVC